MGIWWPTCVAAAVSVFAVIVFPRAPTWQVWSTNSTEKCCANIQHYTSEDQWYKHPLDRLALIASWISEHSSHFCYGENQRALLRNTTGRRLQ